MNIVFDFLVSVVVSVIANVIAYYICKWFDSHF